MDSNIPTPISDNAAKHAYAPQNDGYSHTVWTVVDWVVAADLEQQLFRAKQEIQSLQRWKDEYLSVANELDTQVVGELLGIEIGQSVYANIEPKVRELIQERDQLRKDLEQAEESRKKNAEIIDLMLQYHQQNLESDSIVGSCGCCVKTPDIKFHKKGCKYRLIVERDEARTEVEVLTGEKQAFENYRFNYGE